MANLKQLNGIWYLTDKKYAPYEGSSVLFNNIPTYASFIDELNELCIVTIDGMTKNVGFESVEAIVASSRMYGDELQMFPVSIQIAIANLFVFPTIDGKYGANYPDEDDSVIGYYDTKSEARYRVYEWFSNNNVEIIRHTEYECEYEIQLKTIEITDIKVKL